MVVPPSMEKTFPPATCGPFLYPEPILHLLGLLPFLLQLTMASWTFLLLFSEEFFIVMLLDCLDDVWRHFSGVQECVIDAEQAVCAGLGAAMEASDLRVVPQICKGCGCWKCCYSLN